jgi:hypothetical protein
VQNGKSENNSFALFRASEKYIHYPEQFSAHNTTEKWIELKLPKGAHEITQKATKL